MASTSDMPSRRAAMICASRSARCRSSSSMRPLGSVTGAPWKRTGRLTLSTRAGGGGGGRTLFDTGALMRSVAQRRPQILEKAVRQRTGNLKYARLHQRGGEIRPRRAKMLAIPKTRAARRGGRPRRFLERFPAGRERHEAARKHFIFTKGPVRIPRRRFLGLGRPHRQDLARLIVDRYRAVMSGKGNG